jgi:general secretion pathway protein I
VDVRARPGGEEVKPPAFHFRPGSSGFRFQVSSFRFRLTGFTLVEVLVSIAIFALAAVILGSAYINVLSGYQRMRSSTQDETDLAFVRALVLAEPKLEVIEKGGDVRRPDSTTVHWQAEVEPTNRADLFQVVIECQMPGIGTKQGRTMRDTFLVLRPTWSDPAEREKLRVKFREELLKRKGQT